MEEHVHEASAVKTWFLVLLMVGWVAFKGWLAFTVIGDLGQPDWDYRPIKDVPGESAYAIANPYQPLPYAQHVKGDLGKEENPLHLYVIPFQGVE
jgi:hypothetical protein